MERVTLRFDSRASGGWKEVEVYMSLNACAYSFALGMAYRNTGPFPMRPDADVVVEANGDRVVTGYVDEFDDSKKRDQGRKLQIGGRSRTADLIDCAALSASGEWRSKRFADIVRDLAAPYSVETAIDVADASANEVVGKHKISDGETAFESIDRLAALRGYLLTSDALGRLRVTRAGSGRSSTKIEAGRNTLEAGLNIKTANLYSEYRCKGQRAGSDGDFGATVADANGAVSLSLLQRRRVLILHPEADANNARCKLRATWEAASRLGHAVSLEYTVRGWRQDDGSLWAPNLMVSCVDEDRGVDGDFLLHTVRLRKSRDGGTTATLQLQPRDAFIPTLPEIGKPGKSKGVNGCDAWGFLKGVVVPK